MDTPNLARLGQTDAVQPKRGQAAEPSAPLAGPSFHALLEKLETQAHGLAQNTPTSAQDLSGAVDAARDSLDAALNLGRDLLEAYREAQQNADPPAPPELQPKTTFKRAS
jgi:hypothetical protein